MDFRFNEVNGRYEYINKYGQKVTMFKHDNVIAKIITLQNGQTIFREKNANTLRKTFLHGNFNRSEKKQNLKDLAIRFKQLNAIKNKTPEQQQQMKKILSKISKQADNSKFISKMESRTLINQIDIYSEAKTFCPSTNPDILKSFSTASALQKNAYAFKDTLTNAISHTDKVHTAITNARNEMGCLISVSSLSEVSQNERDAYIKQHPEFKNSVQYRKCMEFKNAIEGYCEKVSSRNETVEKILNNNHNSSLESKGICDFLSSTRAENQTMRNYKTFIRQEPSNRVENAINAQQVPQTSAAAQTLSASN
jgi:hypothetical protein